MKDLSNNCRSVENPIDGDFIKLIEDDFKLINEKFDVSVIKSMSKKKFKKWVKIKVKKQPLII